MLIEKKEVVGELSWVEDTKLKMHTSMCGACKSYKSQNKQMDEAIEHHLEQVDIPQKNLNEKAKSDILKAIINKTED